MVTNVGVRVVAPVLPLIQYLSNKYVGVDSCPVVGLKADAHHQSLSVSAYGSFLSALWTERPKVSQLQLGWLKMKVILVVVEKE